jgi:esterase/lipase
MKHLMRTIAVALLMVMAAAMTFYITHMRNRPDLAPWHTAALQAEYSAATARDIQDLDAYRKLEDDLFRQLEDQVYRQPQTEPQPRWNRFQQGSWSDPDRFSINWNRTFELTAAKPTAGFLMLHGLSDSPYSMRALAQRLRREGAWVVGLRLPGHGTAPAGLTRVDWHDWRDAVRLAARHLAGKLEPGGPLYLVGYSNGAALALEYSLSAIEGEDLPRPAGLLLLSPAVAVTPAAALARWQLLLARLPGLVKLAWLSIQPEYDPYKYNSFAVNAGFQIYRLTNAIARRLQKLDSGDGLPGFPPVLVFQSVLDATIPPQAVVDALLARLAPNNHRLVLFDVNRKAETAALFAANPQGEIDTLFNRRLPFDLTVVTNRTSQSPALEARHQAALQTTISESPLELGWPPGIYSLSHVAIPFPPDDPIYGRGGKGIKAEGLTLGNVELRGERAVLQIPIGDLMRLRYNPFFGYMEQQVLERYFALSGAAAQVAPARGRTKVRPGAVSGGGRVAP